MRPWMTATERCGSHLAVSRSQLSFSEAGQTTTAGIGVVGLERRQRLDRLAQALLVGQEGAPGAQRVAHARPLEGRELAAEHGGGLGDRLAARRARGADLAQRLVVLGAQLVERLLSAEPSTATSCRARKASSGSTTHGSMRQRVARPVGARAARRRRRRRRGPRAPRGAGRSRRRVSLTASRAGGGSSPRSSDGDDSGARRRPCARRRELGQRLGARRGERRQQRAVLALDGALQQRLGDGARARAQDPPAAAVVARGRHAADPARARWPPARRRPARWWSARGSARAPRRRGPRPSRRPAPTTRACPSRSAAAGWCARRRRSAGRRGRRARRSPCRSRPAQLDVGAFLDELHPPSR